MKGQRVTKEQKEKAAAMYASGMTAGQIAKEVGLHAVTVGKILNDMGLKKEKKEEGSLSGMERREWVFWGKVVCGELVIITREEKKELDALRKREQRAAKRRQERWQ